MNGAGIVLIAFALKPNPGRMQGDGKLGLIMNEGHHLAAPLLEACDTLRQSLG